MLGPSLAFSLEWNILNYQGKTPLSISPILHKSWDFVVWINRHYSQPCVGSEDLQSVQLGLSLDLSSCLIIMYSQVCCCMLKQSLCVFLGFSLCALSSGLCLHRHSDPFPQLKNLKDSTPELPLTAWWPGNDLWAVRWGNDLISFPPLGSHSSLLIDFSADR